MASDVIPTLGGPDAPYKQGDYPDDRQGLIISRATFPVYVVTEEAMGVVHNVFYHHSLQVANAECNRRKALIFKKLGDDLSASDEYIGRLLRQRDSIQVRKGTLTVEADG